MGPGRVEFGITVPSDGLVALKTQKTTSPEAAWSAHGKVLISSPSPPFHRGLFLETDDGNRDLFPHSVKPPSQTIILRSLSPLNDTQGIREATIASTEKIDEKVS